MAVEGGYVNIAEFFFGDNMSEVSVWDNALAVVKITSTDVFSLSELAAFPDHLWGSAVLYNYLYTVKSGN